MVHIFDAASYLFHGVGIVHVVVLVMLAVVITHELFSLFSWLLLTIARTQFF